MQMEVDAISAIRHNSRHGEDLTFQKKESLAFANSFTHQGNLKLRPTDSQVISSKALSIAAEPLHLLASNRGLRNAT